MNHMTRKRIQRKAAAAALAEARTAEAVARIVRAMSEQGLRDAREVERARIAESERTGAIIPRPDTWLKWQHTAADSARAETWECSGVPSPRWKQDMAYTTALRQEVETLSPAPGQSREDRLWDGTIYQSVDRGWQTPHMACVTHTEGTARGVVPFGSVVTCSDGVRRRIRHIGGIHGLVWAEPA